jgi:hypothetical protein
MTKPSATVLHNDSCRSDVVSRDAIEQVPAAPTTLTVLVQIPLG